MPRIRQPNAIELGLALGFALVTLPSFAQSAGNKAAAEAIFEQGKLLMQSGDYAQACLKFEASQKLDEGIGTLLYLADCYEKTGRTASAWAMFKQAASMAGAQGEESRQKLANQRARLLEPGLVRITVNVAKGNESLLGFEVRNDGVVVPPAQYGSPYPIDPGEHKIEASAPGKRSYSEGVNVTKNAVPVEIPLLTDLAPPPGATPRSSTVGNQPNEALRQSRSTEGPATFAQMSKDTPVSDGKSQRIFSYVVGAAGLVGVGVGTYYGLTAISHNSQSKSDCPSDPNLCSSAGVDLRNSSLREARISTVAFVVGGVALAAGVVLFSTAPKGQPLQVTVQSAFLPDSAQLSLGGAF